jgi:hypothetical protein
VEKENIFKIKVGDITIGGKNKEKIRVIITIKIMIPLSSRWSRKDSTVITLMCEGFKLLAIFFLILVWVESKPVALIIN